MITYTVFTNQGGREINEDSLIVEEKDGNFCFTLADGLGGHGKGDAASQFLCRFIGTQFRETDSFENFLQKVYASGQVELNAEKRRLHERGMMTTAVTLLIANGMAQWIHMGDSRLYMFRKNKVVLRTVDHSVPQMMVLGGELREKDIRNHPDRNKLLKAFGARDTAVECTPGEAVRLEEKQAFLLCSDGFWELILEKEMTKTLRKSKTVNDWMNAMVEIIVKRQSKLNGNADNFTAIAVWN